MATVQELKAEAAKLLEQAEQQARDEKAAARKAAQEKRAAEAKEHYDRMYFGIGQPLAGLNEAQHAIVYSQAWEQGHASGYEEVEDHYADLAEMARKLIAAS